MFLTTLTFMFTTPGVWQKDYGFPALSASPGQFLIKDVVLLAAAIWTAGDALRAAVQSFPPPDHGGCLAAHAAVRKRSSSSRSPSKARRYT